MFDPVTTDAVSMIVLLSGMAAFAAAVLVTSLARKRPASGETRQRGSLLGVGLQAASFALTAAGPMRITAYRSSNLPRALVVGALVIAAVILFATAARAMGSNWAIVARTRSDHQLVTSGPFALVRNPIYLAMALMLIAVAVGTNRIPALLIAVPLFALGTWIRIRSEERLLRTMFGEEYEAYAMRIKRIIPGLF